MGQRAKELPIGGGYYANYSNELLKLISHGKIDNDILTADELRSRACWSDKFFNFDDQRWHATITPREFKMVAARFKRQWPACPFSVKWLMEDFLRRV